MLILGAAGAVRRRPPRHRAVSRHRGHHRRVVRCSTSSSTSAITSTSTSAGGPATSCSSPSRCWPAMRLQELWRAGRAHARRRPSRRRSSWRSLSLPTFAIDFYNTQDITNQSPDDNYSWTLVLTHDEVAAFAWIRGSTPPEAVVQIEPHAREGRRWADVPAFAERRMSAGLPISMVPLAKYEEASHKVLALYQEQRSGRRLQLARRVSASTTCRRTAGAQDVSRTSKRRCARGRAAFARRSAAATCRSTCSRAACEPDRRRHVEPAAGRGRAHGDRALAGAGAARGRPRGRHRRHAAEPVRASGVGLRRDLADRRRPERGAPHRSGHQPALSELRRAASAPRVLAEPHDARVLRPVGPIQLGPEPAGTAQGERPAPASCTPPIAIC